MKEDKVKKLFDSVEKIANYYGVVLQLNMMAEECSELIHAIMKDKRKNNLESYENIIEEMADVYLVLHQLIFLLEVDNRIIEIANEKADRQLKRISEEVE